MLSTLVFKNCGNAKEKQTLRFKEGLNVLIGDRAWPKTSILDVFEICSSKSNWESRLQDLLVEKQVNAYIICTYDLQDSVDVRQMIVFKLYSPPSEPAEAATVYTVHILVKPSVIETVKTQGKDRMFKVINREADREKIMNLLAKVNEDDTDQSVIELIEIISDGKCELLVYDRLKQEWDKICDSTHFERDIVITGKNGLFQELLQTRNLKTPENPTARLLTGGNNFTLYLGDSDTSIMPCDQFVFQPQQLQKTVVVMASHNPAFLSPNTFSQTYFCREDDRKGTTFIPGAALAEMKSITHRDLRLLTDGKFCSLFFANMVMFMEGEADFTFMKCLKKKILTNHEAISKQIDDPTTMQLLQAFMSGLHLMNMDGETNRRRLTTACDKIGVHCFFILDKDTVIDKVTQKPKEVAKLLKDQMDEKLEKLEYPDQWNNMKAKLEEEAGIFVWSDGDIEDMIIAFSIPKEGLVEIRKETVKEVTEREIEEVIKEEIPPNIKKKTEKSKETKTTESTEETTRYVNMPPEKEIIQVVEFVGMTIDENTEGRKTVITKTETKRKQFYKKTDFLERIEEEIKIPFTRWKMGKKPKFKIYNGVTAERNIDNSMDLLLAHSLESSDNEIRRLLKFLVTKAIKEVGG